MRENTRFDRIRDTSPCRSLFVASLNLAASLPGHRVFACLLIAPEDLGNESHWKMSAWRSGFFHENFIHVYPLKKPNFSLFGMVPSPGGLLLSTLVPQWAVWTLALCTEHCVPVSLQHVPHQNSTSVQCMRCRHARRNYLRPGL